MIWAAVLALGASGALACPFNNSAQLDTQTVASVDVVDFAPVSLSIRATSS